MGDPHRIFRGVVEATSGGPMDGDGHVKQNVIRLRTTAGETISLRNIAVTAEVNLLLGEAVENGDPVELWGRVSKKNNSGFFYGIKTPSADAYQDHGSAKFMFRYGLLAVIASILGSVVIITMLVTPFIFIGGLILMLVSRSAKCLPEEAFRMGADEQGRIRWLDKRLRMQWQSQGDAALA